MYINYKQLHTQGLDIKDLGLLIAIKQKDLELYKELFSFIPIENSILVLSKRGFIEPLKSGKGFKPTKAATAFLRTLSIVDLTDEFKGHYVALKQLYLANGYNDKLGSDKKGLQYYCSFIAETGYAPEKVYKVVEDYLESNSREPKYIRSLQNLIFKADNVFSVKFSLDSSKLYSLCKEGGL